MTRKVTIPPFGTIGVHGNTSVRGHCMEVHVLMEPMPSPQLLTAVVPTVTYGELHLGSSWVPICLCNLSAHSIKIPTMTVVGQVIPPNQALPVVLPMGTSEESNSNPQKGWVLEALDLQGPGELTKPEQELARELLLKWVACCYITFLKFGYDITKEISNSPVGYCIIHTYIYYNKGVKMRSKFFTYNYGDFIAQSFETYRT